MNDTSPEGQKIPVIDIREEKDWKEPIDVTFDQAASLQIARWVLLIFGGVYTLAFIMSFATLWLHDATYDKAVELVKFLVTSILPLVTLAVGYYLGDRRSTQQEE
jgi:hypothetical protein